MRICDKHGIVFEEYHHSGTGSWHTAWSKNQCPVCEAETEIWRHEKCAEGLREMLLEVIKKGERVFRKLSDPEDEIKWLEEARVVLAKAEGKG